MGLFGSSKVTTVGTQVQRVIDDASLPDAIEIGMTKNLRAEEGEGGQMVEYIMEELVSGLAVRSSRYYQYGKSKYVNGLPKSTVKTSLSGKTAFVNAIKAQVGGEIDVDYYHFGPLNNMHAGWMMLQDQLQHDSVTNELKFVSQSFGKEAYLEDMQIVVTEATLAELENGSLEQWGIAPNTGKTPDREVGMLPAEAKNIKQVPFVVDSAASGDYFKVLYVYETTEQVQVPSTMPVEPPLMITIDRRKLVRGSLQVPMMVHDENADYHQMRYIRNGKAYYALYKHGDGVFPTVDAAFNTEFDNLGTFFPWVYFRFNKTAGNANKLTQEYKDSVRLCNIVGFDYEDMCDSINNPPDAEAQGNMKDIEQAIMMLGVPANSTNEHDARYLYDFFDALDDRPDNDTSTASKAELYLMDGLKLQIPVTGMIIQDNKFKMALNYSSISRRKVRGVIGKIGTYAAGRGTEVETVTGMTPNKTPVVKESTAPSHYYRRQITSAMYEEIRVYGLSVTYHIFGQYTTTADEDDKTLLIPVDKAITDTYSLPVKEALISRSLHYVFNSRVVTKLKWYQTGLFKFVMIVVAIIIMVYNIAAGLKTLAAVTTLTAAAIIKMIVIMALKYLLVAAISRLFVKVFGMKIAIIAAIVAAAVGMYQAVDAGSIAGAPWAEKLLMVSNGLSSEVGRQSQKAMEGLIDDYKDWQKDVDTKIKLLEDTNKMLNSTSRLAPIIIFGEKPSDFYQRTVHYGNIGTVGIDAVGSYVDTMLTLPKLSDIEEFV